VTRRAGGARTITAMRVVSLLPSATEILFAVGGGDLLVGRSHECDHPRSVCGLPVLTGQRTVATSSAEIDREVRETLDSEGGAASLYTLDVDLLRSLRPDVILTQDLCAVCSIDLDAVREVARGMDPPPGIVSLDPKCLDDVFDDLLRVGTAVGRETEAHDAMIRLRDEYWTAVDFTNPFAPAPEVGFLEWMDPLFVGGHWTPELIEKAGGRHSLNPRGEKSRQVTPDALVAAAPERLIICPCGYDLAAIERELPALTAAAWWSALPAVRANEVFIVDGSRMFNRPGPRLVEAFRWLVAWLHDRPEVAPPAFPARRVGG